jgi:hypothetical protein
VEPDVGVVQGGAGLIPTARRGPGIRGSRPRGSHEQQLGRRAAFDKWIRQRRRQPVRSGLDAPAVHPLHLQRINIDAVHAPDIDRGQLRPGLRVAAQRKGLDAAG